jgi:hypothetical protein
MPGPAVACRIVNVNQGRKGVAWFTSQYKSCSPHNIQITEWTDSTQKMTAGRRPTHQRKSNIPHSNHAALVATPPEKKTKPDDKDTAAKL